MIKHTTNKCFIQNSVIQYIRTWRLIFILLSKACAASNGTTEIHTYRGYSLHWVKLQSFLCMTTLAKASKEFLKNKKPVLN